MIKNTYEPYGGQGLTLFLQRGMFVWLKEISLYIKETEERKEDKKTYMHNNIFINLNNEIVNILTNMILNKKREGDINVGNK